MSKKRFVFNDDNVKNSYGFHILTAGIDMSRFTDNPVMLSDHINNNQNLIGNWLNVEKKELSIEADPQFDVETDLGKDISGKVERGFLKGCSMGILPNWDKMERVGDRMILMECQLVEVSIVPVPSNRNSIAIYNAEGKILGEDEVKTLCLSITNKNEPLKIKSKNQMKKIILSMAALMALGLKEQAEDGTDGSVLEVKILGLAAANEALKSENETLNLAAQTAKEAQKAENEKGVTALVKLAVTQGKIAADKEGEFIALGLVSASALQTALDAIPPKQNFAAGVKAPEGNGGVEIKTVEDFQKLSLELQLAFKNDNPEEYQELVKTIK